MADVMMFPNTMKEFIDSYSFKDTEEIYTNGAELIPVFRVEQALEHYEKENRNKTIDEFAEALRLKCLDNVYKDVNLYIILRMADEMKGEKNGETDSP